MATLPHSPQTVERIVINLGLNCLTLLGLKLACHPATTITTRHEQFMHTQPDIVFLQKSRL